jgi:hypothetical protein
MMWLRDLVKETYGTDKDLKWDAKTSTATIRGASFKPGITIQNGITSYIYINNEGKMMVESSDFAKAVGLSGQYGSQNPLLDKESTTLALRSEHANEVLKAGSMIPKLDSSKTYILEYDSHDIMFSIDKTTMRVNMEIGNARDYILKGYSYKLAGWLKTLYRGQFGKNYWIEQGPLAAELFGHAAPHELLIVEDKFGNVISKIPSTGIISVHTKIADIGDTMDSNKWERMLWDTLGNNEVFMKLISRFFIY